MPVNEMHETFLEPFILATCDTLREMANTEISVRSVQQNPLDVAPDHTTAMLRLSFAADGYLLLSFSGATGSALAGRVLAGATGELSKSLVCDCLGEIANVVAGQAKAQLAETSFRITFSMPEVVADPWSKLGPIREFDGRAVTFGSECGEFTMQLLSRRRDSTASAPVTGAVSN